MAVELGAMVCVSVARSLLVYHIIDIIWFTTTLISHSVSHLLDLRVTDWVRESTDCLPGSKSSHRTPTNWYNWYIGTTPTKHFTQLSWFCLLLLYWLDPWEWVAANPTRNGTPFMNMVRGRRNKRCLQYIKCNCWVFVYISGYVSFGLILRYNTGMPWVMHNF